MSFQVTLLSPGRLIDFLLKKQDGKPPLFKNAAQIAQQLAALPEAKYTKCKSTEVLLSQIGSAQKPIPLQLKKEIVRLIETLALRKGSELAQTKTEIEHLVASHNSALRKDKWTGAREHMFSDFSAKISSFESTEQFFFISSAQTEGDNAPFSSIFIEHIYSLRVIDPGKASLTNYAKSEPDWDERLWANDPDTLLIRYFVDSETTARKLWKLLFSVAVGDQIVGQKVARPNPTKVFQEIARRLTKLAQGRNFAISVLPSPYNLLCANALVAINPNNPDTCSLFSITDGWAVRLSQNETFTWRNIVQSSRARLLDEAHVCKWSEVESEAIEELATIGPLHI